MERSFLLFVVILATGYGSCPRRWTLTDGDCVYFSPHSTTWNIAERECRDLGGYLVTDDSQEKHKLLSMIANAFLSHHHTSFWLGANDYAVEGSWRWLETGMEIEGVTYWDHGSPNMNKSLNCLSAHWPKHHHSLSWQASDCSKHKYFICEKPEVIHHHNTTTDMPVETTSDLDNQIIG